MKKQSRSRVVVRRCSLPVVEPVERRALMSVAVANGVLTVTGTSAADVISVVARFGNDGDGNATLDVAVSGVSGAGDYSPSVTQPFAAVVVDAGDGDDSVKFTSENVDAPTGVTPVLPATLNGGAGADGLLVDGAVSNVTLDGGDGNDNLAAEESGPGTIYMYGDGGDDTLTAGIDSFGVLYGGDGNDTLINGDAENTGIYASGGPGVDAIELTDESPAGTIDMNAAVVANYQRPANVSRYTVATDVENVTGTVETYNGLTVIGNASANTIDVSDPGNTVSLVGGGGNDVLRATAQQPGDVIYLDGGDGNDTLAGTAGVATHFTGGAGTDVADYSAYPAAVTVRLDGTAPSGPSSAPSDTFTGDVEQVYGSAYNDVLFGTAGNNALYGNGGDDTIVTNGGTDAAFGGDGNDTVYADDGGSTYVDGGGGADTAYVDPTGDTTANVEAVVHRKGGVVVNPTPTRLMGTTYGTPGSYGNGGNTISRATDGNLSTFFDAPTASGSAVGIDLGAAKTVSQIKFAPRSGYAARMVGGVFQASNDINFAKGDVTVYTVKSAPASGSLTTVSTGVTAAYRYWRYVGPVNGYGNVAEFQLFA